MKQIWIIMEVRTEGDTVLKVKPRAAYLSQSAAESDHWDLTVAATERKDKVLYFIESTTIEG